MEIKENAKITGLTPFWSVAEGTPLRQWRDMAQELYDLELSIKSPQTGRK